MSFNDAPIILSKLMDFDRIITMYEKNNNDDKFNDAVEVFIEFVQSRTPTMFDKRKKEALSDAYNSNDFEDKILEKICCILKRIEYLRIKS